MVCRALNELEDGCVAERRVLIAMDRRTDLAAAADEFANLTLESFDGRRTSFLRRVVAAALSERIDLALIGHVNYAPIGLLLKRLRPNLRYGVMLHGVEAWSRLPRIRRRAVRNADFVMSVSDYTKQQVVEANGVNPEKVYLLPNTLAWDGNEAGRWREGETEGTRKGTRFLSVCRLDAREQYKGIDTVIKALPAARVRVPDLEYVVIGSGSDLERNRATFSFCPAPVKDSESFSSKRCITANRLSPRTAARRPRSSRPARQECWSRQETPTNSRRP